MGKCRDIRGLRLDNASRNALKNIRKKYALGKKLAVVLSSGVFANIFVNNNIPTAAISITQTDWNMFSLAMTSIPTIVNSAVRTEIEMMILHYEMNYDHKHLMFWKGLYYGCKNNEKK